MKKLVLVMVMLAAAVAQAEDKKDKKDATAGATPPAAPPAAKMSDEGKKLLEGLRGKWTAKDASFTMGEVKAQGTLKMTCEAVSGGWGTLCKGVFNFKGAPPQNATFLFGWDIATGEAHMFEIGDTGEVHDHSGKWLDDKSVSLVRQGKNVEGKDEKDDCKATFNSAKEMVFACTGTQGATTAWTFTSTNKK